MIVNRLWQQHFGVGLVATASDFGRLGERPSHPELLDWLAVAVDRGGLEAQAPAPADHDLGHLSPECLARRAPRRRGGTIRTAAGSGGMGIRRLDADQIRDTLLAVSGELDPRQGGPSVEPTVPRRTIYTKLDPLQPGAAPCRLSTPPMVSSASPARYDHDGDPGALAPERPLGAGSRRGDRQAARHGVCQPPDDPLWSSGLPPGAGTSPRCARDPRGRSLPPRAAEADRGRVAVRREAGRRSDQALIDLCHVLLNSNELIYVD